MPNSTRVRSNVASSTSSGSTDHCETHCSAEDIGRVFPDVIRHAEQPIVRTAPAPLLLLSKLVREQGYKVVLTGEGSDEVLGGYDIFKEAKVRRFWAQRPDSRLRPLLLKRLYPYLPRLQSQSPAYLRAFFHADPADLGDPFFSHRPRWEMSSRMELFLSGDARQTLNGYQPIDDLEDTLPDSLLAVAGVLPGAVSRVTAGLRPSSMSMRASK